MDSQQTTRSHGRTQQRRTLLDVSTRNERKSKERRLTTKNGPKLGLSNQTTARRPTKIGPHVTQPNIGISGGTIISHSSSISS